MTPSRRTVLTALGLAAAAALAGCSSNPSAVDYPPIVFVHGNGDSAALWQTTMWRFESNGWPRDRLYAINVPYPSSRDDDTVVQAGRTSTAEHMAFLRSEVEAVLARTGAQQVVLMGNSRGGYAIRNYIARGGGAAKVREVVLGGTPNHGVWAIPGYREGSEFSGTGPFLKALNAPRNAAGDEIDGPARWLTVRSDGNDKFAQPDGLWIGRPGLPTFVTAAGPELRGAASVVIPKIDHRETSFSPAAFDAGWRFLTGAAPLATTVQTEAAPVLDGIVSDLGVAGNAAAGNVSNNLPVAGATVEIYPTDPDTGTRRGGPAHRRTVGPDGRWGPFTATAGTPYEFVVSAQGYAITHIYRSGFPRSSNIVHLRAERIVDAERSAQAVVSFTRPRGYFDLQRDTVSFDGSSSLPDVPPTSGAGVAASKRLLADGTDRAIVGSFNGEKVVGRTWPLAGGHLAFLELTY